MRVDIAWWELKGPTQTIDSLREHLANDTVDEWARVPGLRLKLWIADRRSNRWGAVMLWESDQTAPGLLPPNRAAELIGRPADYRTRFDVEVGVEGAHTLGIFPGLGPVATTEAT
jgi:trans-2,3-dihydro-3-hydroxyanthranilate isomerase